MQHLLHLMLVPVLALLLLFPAPSAPVLASENAALTPTDTWKQFLHRDCVFDLALSGEYLWAGVSGGVVLHSLAEPGVHRFYHALNSPLRASHVYAVLADGAGGAWLGTDQGAYHVDSSHNWTYYGMENSMIPDKPVRALARDASGDTWFGTWGGGAVLLDSLGSWHTYNSANSPLPGNYLYAVTPDAAGGVWFGTDNRGAAHRSPGGTWEIYNVRNSPLPVNDVLHINSSAGKTWFATYQGLASLDAAGTWTLFNTENSLLETNHINGTAIAGDNTVWVATAAGLARLQAGEVAEIFNTANSKLPDNTLNSVLVDDKNTVWVATAGGGLAAYAPTAARWQTFSSEYPPLATNSYLPSGSVKQVVPFPVGETSGQLWFVTAAGVHYYDTEHKHWGSLALPPGWPGDNIESMAINQDGRIALASAGSGAALRSPAGSWTVYTTENSSLPSDTVVDVAFDAAGGTWLATFGGGAACLTARQSWQLYNVENGALPVDNLHALALDSAGNTWLGTWGGGLVRLGSDGTSRTYNTTNSPLPSNDIRALLATPGGELWLGTWGGGLARLDSNGSFSVFNTANTTLPSDNIQALAQDTRGWLWAATSVGTVYYDGSSWQSIYPGETGLPAGQILNLCADAAGNLWFASAAAGAAVYNPAGIPASIRAISAVPERLDEIILFYGKNYIEPDVPPVIAAGRVLLPMRSLFTALGAEIDWNAEKQEVTALLHGREIRLTINDQTAYVDGTPQALDVPARIIDGRTMVPLRFAAESLGLEVTWDARLNAVILQDKP